MAIASSSKLRPGPHKKQENTPIAYAQKERWQRISRFLFVFQKVKGMNKKHLTFLLYSKKHVGSEDQGPEILQGKNEREGIK